jgi:hypothetical protein
VLGLDGDDVLALRFIEVRGALQRQVVRFGRARSPDDLARIGADQRGDVRARFLDGRLGAPAIRNGIMASATRGSTGVVAE